QNHANLRGMAVHCLVDRVVQNFPDEVMQTCAAYPPDVHAGTLADRIEALEDRDVLGAVLSAFRVGLLRAHVLLRKIFERVLIHASSGGGALSSGGTTSMNLPRLISSWPRAARPVSPRLALTSCSPPSEVLTT